MITIIHGDDQVKSRQHFQEQKQKANDYISLSLDRMTIESLTEIAHGSGLFSDTKKVFVESFLSKTKFNSKASKELVRFINKNSSLLDLAFWEDSTILPRTIKMFSEPKVMLFKLPQNVFLFLDSIKPSNGKQSISLFRSTIKEVEIELVFFMLIRQIRILLAICEDVSEEKINEVSRLQPWQLGRLQKQSSLFSKNKLKNIYKKLYQIDTQQKTGVLPYPLGQCIDFLLLDI